MITTSPSRRDAIRRVGASALATAAWSELTTSAVAAQSNATRKRLLRIAQLTDVHVQPE